jgi:spore coat polysaccharide biosynthesis protein SpsF
LGRDCAKKETEGRIRVQTGIIIQARTGSSRLPNKVLKRLPYNSDITVLEQVIKRLSYSKLTDKLIIATTTKMEEQPIVDIALKNKVLYYRGSEEDVLSRYYYAARENKIDIIVRITSDCPCCDSDLVDQIIKKFLDEDIDYISNVLERTYPRGYDVEVFSFNALEQTFKNAKEKEFREHVTLYIIKNKDKFKIQNYSNNTKIGSNIRLTLDTKMDYILLCSIYDELYSEDNFFNMESILNLYYKKPWIFEINKNIVQKKVYENEEEEMNDAIQILNRQGLYRIKSILENTRISK